MVVTPARGLPTARRGGAGARNIAAVACVVPGRPTRPVNWLLILGLSRNGRPDLAERLRADTLAAIERAGFAERFIP